MPWESLLAMAMRKYRNHERTIVYRHIRGLDPHSEAPKSELPLKALFVETAPGKFRNEFDFGPQFQAVKGFLNGVVLQYLKHPSLADLETFIAKEKPAIIHVSGIDGSLGIQILKRLAEEAGEDTSAQAGTAEEQRKEGIFFRGSAGEPKRQRSRMLPRPCILAATGPCSLRSMCTTPKDSLPS